MRIDKYLKVARLIKRRSVANEACDQGRITAVSYTHLLRCQYHNECLRPFHKKSKAGIRKVT